MHLPEEKSSLCIILGADSWPFFEGLNGGSPFTNSAALAYRFFVSKYGFGLATENVLNLFNSELSAADQGVKIEEFIKERSDELGNSGDRLSDLCVYYVGHGDFYGPTSDLLMLVRNTRPKHDQTGIQCRALARILKSSAPFSRQFIVLDCCWSGTAIQNWQSTSPIDHAAKKVTEEFPKRGTVLLCSSSKDSPSMAPEESAFTLFSKALFDTLLLGDAGYAEKISARQLRELAYRRMEEEWPEIAVRPVAHGIETGSGDLSDLPVFRNHKLTKLDEFTALFDGLSVNRDRSPELDAGPAVTSGIQDSSTEPATDKNTQNGSVELHPEKLEIKAATGLHDTNSETLAVKSSQETHVEQQSSSTKDEENAATVTTEGQTRHSKLQWRNLGGIAFAAVVSLALLIQFINGRTDSEEETVRPAEPRVADENLEPSNVVSAESTAESIRKTLSATKTSLYKSRSTFLSESFEGLLKPAVYCVPNPEDLPVVLSLFEILEVEGNSYITGDLPTNYDVARISIERMALDCQFLLFGQSMRYYTGIEPFIGELGWQKIEI